MAQAQDRPPLDWLWLLLLSWVPPVVVSQWGLQLEYFASLLFWLIPIVILGRRVLLASRPSATSGVPYSRRRHALYWMAAYMLGAGLLLDFVFGRWVLQFGDRDRYLWVIPWGDIPVEEVLFYALGPFAILAVYAWCDECWLMDHRQAERRESLSEQSALVDVAWPAAAVGVAIVVAGIAWKKLIGPAPDGWPVYFVFLVFLAFVPAVIFYRLIATFVNWPAFAVTTLYVIATSLLWEASLGLPRQWWGYQPTNILGFTVKDWTRDPVNWPFPVEAAFVWVCAPFSCILVYEYVRCVEYRRARRRARE